MTTECARMHIGIRQLAHYRGPISASRGDFRRRLAPRIS